MPKFHYVYLFFSDIINCAVKSKVNVPITYNYDIIMLHYYYYQLCKQHSNVAAGQGGVNVMNLYTVV